MKTRDIVVVGASAGGVESLQQFVRPLNPDLQAAIFIVMHLGADSPNLLAEILRRNTAIPVETAAHQMPIRRNCIYTAVRDRHLLIDKTHMYTPAGPKENLARPAIDPLFRSAAVAHDSCVIGVILSGMLDDGTSGLMAVKDCGGMAIVQDPKTALFPEMCRSALQKVKVDHCAGLSDIAPLLNESVKPCAPHEIELPKGLIEEVNFSFGKIKEVTEQNRTGSLVPMTCPSCGGPMWEVDDKTFLRYRCYTGHHFTAQTLSAEINTETENALWFSLQLVKERTRLLERMAEQETFPSSQQEFRKKVAETTEHSRRLLELITSVKMAEGSAPSERR